MTAKETITSWKWRVAKSNKTAQEFCISIGLDPSQFSQYVCGKKNPSLPTFDLIESKLKELGV